MRRFAIAIVVVAAVSAVLPARAADDPPEVVCRSGVTPESRIAACGQVIGRGAAEPIGGRISAYLRRADAYGAQIEVASSMTDKRLRRAQVIADLNEALALNPKQTGALFTRAITRAPDEPEAAIADYAAAIAINPRTAGGHALNNRGVLYRDRGENDRAMIDFQEALSLYPRDWFALRNRGYEYLRRGDLPKALADFNQALTLDFKRAETLVGRARVHEKMRDFASAVADYDAAVAADPKNIGAQRGRDAVRQLAAGPPAQPGKPAPAKAGAPAPPATPRVALVVGNGTYRTLPSLPNPANDARDIAQSLKGLGFSVVLAVDATREVMESRLAEFARAARGAEAAFVFYAGHGLQHQGVNYLAPVDAAIADETDLRRMIRVQDMLQDLQNAKGVRILVLDACRDNEALKQLTARLAKTRSAAPRGGLAEEKAEGVLIAYATQPDRVAADGAGRNSPFTQALLRHIETPRLEVRTLFIRVRGEVLKATGGAQRPEVSDSLDGEFAFKER